MDLEELIRLENCSYRQQTKSHSSVKAL